MDNLGVSGREVILEAINRHGINDTLTALFRIGKVTDGNSVGQITIHINNGGVTKICRNNWEIK